MAFSSFEFLLIYFPIVLVGYFFLVGKQHWPVWWLTCMSFIFYGWSAPPLLSLLAISSLFNYMLGQVILRTRSKNLHVARAACALGICANLGVLAYFKYSGFLLSILAPGDLNGARPVLVTIGISFFTFTQTAFLVDAIRGVVRSISFPDYLCFVSYFPHLNAGPIIHYREMAPQFDRACVVRPSALDVAVGVTIFAFGLFKKTVLADSFAPLAAAAFDQPVEAISGVDAWTGVLGYTLQIYFDFSAYSDMAVGLSLFFGVRLPINFNSPYKATSIIEFWNRWHISLSRFLRDYLYIPLGGNRRGALRRYSNLMLTMLIGGLWHGAGWQFVIWGGLHGAYLVINHLARQWIGPPNNASFVTRCLKRAVVLSAVAFAWVFFRSDSVGHALAILSALTQLQPTGVPEQTTALLLGGGFLLCLLSPNALQLLAPERPVLEDARSPLEKISDKLVWRPSYGWLIITTLTLTAGILSISKQSPFLYYQF